MNRARGVLGLILLAGLLSAVLALEVSVWQECRATHTWFYCFRTLG